MSVPKCKECEFYESKQRENYIWKKHIDHYCHATIKTDKEGYQTGQKKFIYTKDLKTSPGWCPKRINDNYMNNLLNKYGRNK